MGSNRTRPEQLATYLIANKSTIRKTAEVFKISKSTVHNDLSKKLFKINKRLYKKVRVILEENFNERHIRGGNATRLKYQKNTAN